MDGTHTRFQAGLKIIFVNFSWSKTIDQDETIRTSHKSRHRGEITLSCQWQYGRTRATLVKFCHFYQRVARKFVKKNELLLGQARQAGLPEYQDL